MNGNTKDKRLSWKRKKRYESYLKLSCKKCKRKFQRKLRQGKCSDFKLIGNSFKKNIKGNAKAEYFP